MLRVSSGASTGAVVAVVLGVGGGAVSLSAGAFVGAICPFAPGLLLRHTLGSATDRMGSPGSPAMQLFSALTSFVVMTSADAEQTRGVLFWLLGSLSGVTWCEVVLCTAEVAGFLVVCLAHARTLDACAFGQDAAGALGVHVARTRIVLLCTTALLTAAVSARPEPTRRAPASGTKLSFMPNMPVLTVTQSGLPVSSSTYTRPTLPTFSPSLSYTVRPSSSPESVKPSAAPITEPSSLGAPCGWLHRM
ncbi:Vitamin B12 import system permease protein BtuC [Streptomyces cyaneofuscatus]